MFTEQTSFGLVPELCQRTIIMTLIKSLERLTSERGLDKNTKKAFVKDYLRYIA